MNQWLISEGWAYDTKQHQWCTSLWMNVPSTHNEPVHNTVKLSSCNNFTLQSCAALHSKLSATDAVARLIVPVQRLCKSEQQLYPAIVRSLHSKLSATDAVTRLTVPIQKLCKSEQQFYPAIMRSLHSKISVTDAVARLIVPIQRLCKSEQQFYPAIVRSLYGKLSATDAVARPTVPVQRLCKNLLKALISHHRGKPLRSNQIKSCSLLHNLFFTFLIFWGYTECTLKEI